MNVKVNSIRPLNTESKIKAFVDLIFEGQLVVKGFKIVEGKDGLFVAYPSEKNKDGKFFNNVLILPEDLRKVINDVVLESYNTKV